MSETIKAGGKALLTYPAGDCDWVDVLSLNADHAVVRLPDGSQRAVVIEDLGLGVDDELVGVTDDGVRLVHGVAAPGSYHCPCGWSRVILEGETVEQAQAAHEGTDVHRLATEQQARFAGFGPELPADKVPDAVRAGFEVWSFGYGEDEDFTVITEGDLWAWEDLVEPDSAHDLAAERRAEAEAVIASWAPFRLGHGPLAFGSVRCPICDHAVTMHSGHGGCQTHEPGVGYCPCTYMDEPLLNVAGIIASASYTYRSDYEAEVAWPEGLANALGWECESATCNDEEYHGWPKWERIEKRTVTLLFVECGHCGAETTYDAAGQELDRS